MGSRRTVRLLAGLLLGVGLAGCAAVPHDGVVHLGRVVPPIGSLDESDIRVLPPPPQPDWSPEQVVRGFLDASANFEDDHAIAKEYLTTAAAQHWKPTGVTTYTEGQLTIDTSRPGVAVVTGEQDGAIDANGAYHTGAGRLRVVLPMEKVAGRWRIAKGPAKLLLSTIDVQRSFRPVDVYYLDPSLHTVVPDRVFLQVPRRGLATAMVRQLLAGPTKWLAPAVRSAFPAGTDMIGTVPVDRGVADVNLTSQVLQASPVARQALSAQLVWTLRQLSEVTAVQVRAGGQPLAVPGVGEAQPRDAWADFAPPTLPPDTEGFYVHAHRLLRTDGTVVAGPLGSGHAPLDHPVVSTDLAFVAGTSTTGGTARLLLGPLSGRPSVRLTGRSVTPPTWDGADRAWTVVVGFDGISRLWVVPAHGDAFAVPAPDLMLAGRVMQFQLSRDGTRFAAVVSPTGSGEDGVLYVGRVANDPKGLVAGGLRTVLDPDQYVSASDVTWYDVDRVATLVREAGQDPPGSRQPLVVQVDGSTAALVPITGLPAPPVDLAATSGHPMLVSAAAQVWSGTSGNWQVLGPGGMPSYP